MQMDVLFGAFFLFQKIPCKTSPISFCILCLFWSKIHVLAFCACFLSIFSFKKCIFGQFYVHSYFIILLFLGISKVTNFLKLILSPKCKITPKMSKENVNKINSERWTRKNRPFSCRTGSTFRFPYRYLPIKV